MNSEILRQRESNETSKSIRPWMELPYTELMESDIRFLLNQVGNKVGQVTFVKEILLHPDYVSESRLGKLKPLVTSLHESPFWAFWALREFAARNSIGLMNYLSRITR